MGLPQHRVAMTARAFIAWGNQQPDKHEFVAGEVFRRQDSGDGLLMASEGGQRLILKSLEWAAPLDAVFEDA